MLCRTVQGVYPHLTTSGLCHSVQGTAAMLARLDRRAGAMRSPTPAPASTIRPSTPKFLVERQGRLSRSSARPSPSAPRSTTRRSSATRCSSHWATTSPSPPATTASTTPWFRKRPDLIEKYCKPGTGWNPGEYAYILHEYRNREHTWRDEIDKWFKEPRRSQPRPASTPRTSSTPSSATARCSSSTATCATSA